ncbi:MAG: TniB family NTP-binding protein [Sterolibacteriaceae bacterium MAG5]|nr:TniB family NTP-binding protein [Candidatus Nitricoxidireducens bremensis]
MTKKTLDQAMIDTAVADFRKFVIAHPKAKEAFFELMTALQAMSAPQIIILTGPTGAGKSTLAQAARNKLLKRFEAQMLTEPDFVPVVTINAVPPNGSTFSWKDFHIRLLSGQSEPLVNRKLYIPPQATLLPTQVALPPVLGNSTADALRRSVEQYLKLRRTKVMIIDEAHHLLLVGGLQRLECQFESLKSLTIETGVTILLVGTYRLLDILDQSGQLTRRSQVINYARYDYRRRTDLESFRKLLVNFERRMCELVETKLDEHADYFYRKSGGCVGILKDWLSRCLEHALCEGNPLINAGFAERFAIKNRGLVTIVEEACLGEERVADVGDDRLLDLLKNGVLLASERPTTRKVRRPGTRNPKRDPVGEVAP